MDEEVYKQLLIDTKDLILDLVTINYNPYTGPHLDCEEGFEQQIVDLVIKTINQNSK